LWRLRRRPAHAAPGAVQMERRAELEWPVVADGTVHAVVFWFRLHLSGGGGGGDDDDHSGEDERSGVDGGGGSSPPSPLPAGASEEDGEWALGGAGPGPGASWPAWDFGTAEEWEDLGPRPEEPAEEKLEELAAAMRRIADRMARREAAAGAAGGAAGGGGERTVRT
jgi:hypothetical protein